MAHTRVCCCGEAGRCGDREAAAGNTGLRNLPFHGYDQNRIWVDVVALAADLLTWMQTLAFDEHEPAADGNPNASASDCWPSPAASSGPADGYGFP